MLGVFGSAARPSRGEAGDLDLAVGFLRPGSDMLLRLLSELVTLTGYDNLDLVVDGAEPVLCNGWLRWTRTTCATIR